MKYLITGGAGSFGREMAKSILAEKDTEKLVVYSRDEFKHAEMQREYADQRLRFITGDVRNYARLVSALRGIDIVIHAAAMKRIEVCEYNPAECLDVNVNGTLTVIRACVDTPSIRKAIFISTDKAVQPVNLYGASKMAAERAFLAANVYRPIFSVVRYGNVMKSRGSVINYFSELVRDGASELPVTDLEMTRFCMQYEDAIRLVWHAIDGHPQYVYVAKAPSYSIADVCKAFGLPAVIVGMRPGEKLHETLVSSYEMPRAYDCGDHYEIYPETPCDGDLPRPFGVQEDCLFQYDSYTNHEYLNVDEIRGLL